MNAVLKLLACGSLDPRTSAVCFARGMKRKFVAKEGSKQFSNLDSSEVCCPDRLALEPLNKEHERNDGMDTVLIATHKCLTMPHSNSCPKLKPHTRARARTYTCNRPRMKETTWTIVPCSHHTRRRGRAGPCCRELLPRSLRGLYLYLYICIYT